MEPKSIRLDLAHARTYQAREGSPQTAWTNVGVGFLGTDSINLRLHYVPTSTDDGRTKLVLFPPKEGDEPGALPDGLPDRFKVLHPRTFEGRGEEMATKWTLVGMAFRNGHKSITVLLDYVPSQRAGGDIQMALKDAADDSEEHQPGGEDEEPLAEAG